MSSKVSLQSTSVIASASMTSNVSEPMMTMQHPVDYKSLYKIVLLLSPPLLPLPDLLQLL